VRLDALRLGAAVVVVALLIVAGLEFVNRPGDRVLHGRMGEIHTHSR
jgi:hypothetical protein